MNVCIPVLADRGLGSELSSHFGSAPTFIIVDTETGQHHAVENKNLHHTHGMCQPLSSLGGQEVDAIVAGGIGRGALDRLRAAGLDVYRSEYKTVGETIEALKGGKLSRVDPAGTCGHHGHEQHSSCCHSEASAS